MKSHLAFLFLVVSETPNKNNKYVQIQIWRSTLQMREGGIFPTSSISLILLLCWLFFPFLVGCLSHSIQTPD